MFFALKKDVCLRYPKARQPPREIRYVRNLIARGPGAIAVVIKVVDINRMKKNDKHLRPLFDKHWLEIEYLQGYLKWPRTVFTKLLTVRRLS